MKAQESQQPAIYDQILIVGPNHPEYLVQEIQKAWDAAGITNYKILGDGKRGVSYDEIDCLLQSSGESTHIYYIGHGRVTNGMHAMRISDNLEHTDLLLNKNKDVPGIRHIISCYAGAAKNAVENFPDNIPIIFHSGKKYSTLISMNVDAIAAQGKFSHGMKGICDAYTSFERSFLTSPETVNISVKIDNEVKTFKAHAPNHVNESGSVEEKGLELYLQSQLNEFREFRRKVLGHTEDMFVNMNPLMTRQNRVHYLELAMIMEANREKSKYAVKYINGYLDSGVDVNCALSDVTVPLYFACQNGHLELATLLLEKGAEVGKADNNGFTPLYIACEKGRLEIARLLLDKGAEVNKAYNKGSTPLYIACQNGHLELATLLLDKGADINKGLYDTFTPLMVAALAGKERVVDLLLTEITDPAYLSKRTDTTTAEKFCADKKIDMPQGHRDLLEKTAADMAGTRAIAKKIKNKITELEKNPVIGKYTDALNAEKTVAQNRDIKIG